MNRSEPGIKPDGAGPSAGGGQRRQGSVLTVRYFAGARAAAGGISTETVPAASIEELTVVLTERHGERLALVLKAASFLVDGLACHDRQASLPAGATVDVLPPFAGG